MRNPGLGGLGNLLLAGLLLAARPLVAQAPPASSVRPAAYLLGTFERGSGEAYAPPNADLSRDDAVNLGFSLDASRAFDGGRFDASVFALSHDPFSSAERGFYAAGRARAIFGGKASSWVFRIEDAPRLQRRDTVGLSDFQRNELWVELEHRDTGLGVRLGDRRRRVPNDPDEGFDRQGVSVFLSGGSPTRAWRLDVGPQRYSTTVGDGWRLATSIDLVGAFQKVTAALRLAWFEPLTDTKASTAAALTPNPQPTPVPTPAPTPDPTLPPPPPPPGGSPVPPAPEPEPAPIPAPVPPPAAESVPPDSFMSSARAPSLLGPSLVVDALDSDEGDWDFGRRKQEIIGLVSRRFPGALLLTLEAHAQRERGPDLAAPSTAFIRRDRIAARLSVRREIGPRFALIAQGGFRWVRDSRPASSYTWGIVCVGLEVRP